MQYPLLSDVELFVEGIVFIAAPMIELPDDLDLTVPDIPDTNSGASVGASLQEVDRNKNMANNLI